VGRDCATIVERHAKHSVAQHLVDEAHHFNRFFLCHARIFLVGPKRRSRSPVVLCCLWIARWLAPGIGAASNGV
jgi:hypothetical protein